MKQADMKRNAMKDATKTAAPQGGQAEGLRDTLNLLHEQVFRNGALSTKTKEMVALATSVAARCDTCVAYHLHNALEAGATREEIDEVLDVVIMTLGEPAALYDAQVARALADEGPGHSPKLETLRKRLAHPVFHHPYMSPD
jgi:AhpD family alkylhydroperoxidase